MPRRDTRVVIAPRPLASYPVPRVDQAQQSLLEGEPAMAKKEALIERARGHMDPDENILAAVEGQYEAKVLGNDVIRKGILMATDRRLVFYAKKIGGFDFESFPYENISSFEQGKNMMGQTLSFFASGNKVQMKWIKDADLPGLASEVRNRMGKSAPTQAAPDSLDQLKKLGELRDSGLISPEEFEAKKKQLLGL